MREERLKGFQFYKLKAFSGEEPTTAGVANSPAFATAFATLGATTLFECSVV